LDKEINTVNKIIYSKVKYVLCKVNYLRLNINNNLYLSKSFEAISQILKLQNIIVNKYKRYE